MNIVNLTVLAIGFHLILLKKVFLKQREEIQMECRKNEGDQLKKARQPAELPPIYFKKLRIASLVSNPEVRRQF